MVGTCVCGGEMVGMCVGVSGVLCGGEMVGTCVGV